MAVDELIEAYDRQWPKANGVDDADDRERGRLAQTTGQAFPLTTDRVSSVFAVWSPDGTRVAFSRSRRPRGLSPDGKWLAYASAISGATEVYVRPYPQPGSGVQVSVRGGTEPMWSRDGKELFYRSSSRIMSVVHRPLSGSDAFGAPQLLFSGAYDFSQGHNWSPSPDASFIMIKADPTTGRQLRVAFNWFDELRGASKAK